VPRVPTVHPMASVGTRGQHQTRTPRNVRSGMAAIPRQEKLPGDPWETPPSMKSVGRPPIVTAARSQAPGDASGGGSLLSRSAEKTSSSSKRSWTRATEPEQPHSSEPASPGNAPRRGLWRWAEAQLLLAETAAAPVLHHCSGSAPGSPTGLALPPRVHPAGTDRMRPAPTAGPQRVGVDRPLEPRWP